MRILVNSRGVYLRKGLSSIANHTDYPPYIHLPKGKRKNENYYGAEGSNFSMHEHSLNA